MDGMLLGLALLAAWAAITIILPIVTAVRVYRVGQRLDALEQRLAGAARAVEDAAPVRLKPDPTTVEGAALSAPIRLKPDPTAVEGAAPLAPARPRPLGLERRIGSHWLLYAGIGAVLLGASYFIKYAIENEWLGPGARTALGVAAGLALVYAGQRQVARGLGFFGHALSGGGFGLVFLSLYAAYQLYHRLSAPVAFGLMVATAGVAAWRADRTRSGLLALVAVIGGFATPFLASSGQNAPVTLFTYLALLIAATLILARRHHWQWLHVVSYVATAFTWMVWADAYWTRTDWPVTQVFLTLHALLLLAGARGLPAPGTWLDRSPAAALWSVPIVYHVASVINLDAEPVALLVYLTAITLVAVVVAEQMRWPWLRALAWVAVALALLAFPEAHPARRLVWPTLVTMLAVHVLHLMAVLRSARPGWHGVDIGLLHVNALWLVPAFAEAVEPHAAWWIERFAWMLTAAYAAMGWWAWHAARAAFPHLLFLAATLAAIALAATLDGPWLTVAWAVEGATLLRWGLQGDRPWFRRGGALLAVLASVRLAGELAQPLAADAAILFNQRAATTALVMALLAWVARAAIRREPGTWRRSWPIATLVVGAAVLGATWLTAEIHAAFGLRAWTLAYTAPAAALASSLGREATVSVAWAVYAFLLVAAGIRWRYAPVRYLGIALFALALAKVLLVDLSRLDRIYRILSVMGLGVLLVLASYLYQRLLEDGDEESGVAPSGPSTLATGEARLDRPPADSGGSAGGTVEPPGPAANP